MRRKDYEVLPSREVQVIEDVQNARYVEKTDGLGDPKIRVNRDFMDGVYWSDRNPLPRWVSVDDMVPVDGTEVVCMTDTGTRFLWTYHSPDSQTRELCRSFNKQRTYEQMFDRHGFPRPGKYPGLSRNVGRRVACWLELPFRLSERDKDDILKYRLQAKATFKFFKCGESYELRKAGGERYYVKENRMVVYLTDKELLDKFAVLHDEPLVASEDGWDWTSAVEGYCEDMGYGFTAFNLMTDYTEEIALSALKFLNGSVF